MINTIIFDLGGVLIDWNPKYLYRKIFSSEEEITHFLEQICTPEWNEEQDGGRSIADGTEWLVQKHPDHEQQIRAFYDRWTEMLGDPLSGTVDIFRQLRESGKHRIYALTNWSAETFPIARERYDFLNWFDGIVVSGEERMRKPFPEFYQLLLDRYKAKAEECIFIDDNYRNVAAAEAVGISGIHFTSAEQLRTELENSGLIY